MKELWKHTAGIDKECSKLFIGRATLSTAGVEGFFIPDGINVEYILFINTKSP